MEKPQAVLFDFGDTLLHEKSYDPVAGNKYLYSIADNPGKVSFEQYYNYIRKLDEAIMMRRLTSCLEHTWEDFNKIVFEYFGMQLPVSYQKAELEFWKKSLAWIKPPFIDELLQYLKSQGIRAGVVSNSAFSARVLSWELEDQDLLAYFEFVISSADYGIRKPHPLLFELAAAKIGSAPGNTWFTGDMQEYDIYGSRSAGMTAFHYIGKDPRKADNTPGQIGSWKQFREIIAAAG